MFPVSDRFLTSIRASHRMVAYADFLFPDGSSATAKITSGTVSIDRTAQVRRTCDLNIVLTSKASTIIDRLKKISPYTTRVQVWRGIRFTDGVEELVPLGRFWIDDMTWGADEAGISLRLSDQSAVVAAATMPFRRMVKSNSTLSVISALIAETYAATWNSLTAVDNLIRDPDVPDLLMAPTGIEGNRWELITGLAGGLGADVWADHSSTKFRLTPYPVLELQDSVFTVDADEDGVLVDYSRTLSRSAVYNSVLARSTMTSEYALPINALAEDTDPTSPTYVGTYGRSVLIIEDDTLNTSAKCQAAADGALANSLGLQSALDLTTVPNPALDAGDCITVQYPSGLSEKHLIDALTIPLDDQGQFTIRTRSTTERL